MRDRLDGAGAGRRRRGVRLPRRARAPGAGWMQRLGLEWAFRLAQEPRRLWRRYLRYNPRFVVGFARQYAAPPGAGCAARRASLSRRCRYDVSVIGLGRVGLPLALSLRRPRPARARHRQGRRAPAAPARGPHAVQGAGHATSCSSASRAGRLDADRARRRRRRRPTRIVLTLGTPSLLAHRDRHAATSARCSTRCCPHLRAGHLLVLRSTVAPGTTEFVAGYLEKQRGFARRRGRLRRARARADRRRPLPRGDRHAAVHRRRRRRGLGRARRRGCSRCSARRSCRRRRCRPSWPRSGRTSCATRRSRCRTC